MAAFIGFYLSELILGSCPGASQLTPLTTCQLDVSVTKMQYFVTMLNLSYQQTAHSDTLIPQLSAIKH